MKSTDFKIQDEVVNVKGEINDNLMKAVINGKEIEGEFLPVKPGSGIWKVDGVRYKLSAVENQGKIWVSVNGKIYTFDLVNDDDGYGDGGNEDKGIAAPMPGKVIKLMVAKGDTVEEGQPVIIVEAMKMEHTLRAPKSGIITELRCEEGQQVDAGIQLAEIEEQE